MSEAMGVVVAHGSLAAGLVEAAEHISGISDALSAISNLGLSPEALREQLAGAVDGKPAIVFVDLATGSCGFTGRALCHNKRDIALLTGVNLPMLSPCLSPWATPVGAASSPTRLPVGPSHGLSLLLPTRFSPLRASNAWRRDTS